MKIYFGRTAKEMLEAGISADVSFPEVEGGLPLHPKEIVNNLNNGEFFGETTLTMSEHAVLWLCKQVLDGHIGKDEFAIYYLYKREDGTFYHQHIRIDDDGDIIDNWPGGFFNERIELLF